MFSGERCQLREREFHIEKSQKVNGLVRNKYSVQLEGGESNRETAHTKKEALAAVTVPWGLINAGFNLAICSGVETRIPLSAVTVTVRPKTNKEMTLFSVFSDNDDGKTKQGERKKVRKERKA